MSDQSVQWVDIDPNFDPEYYAEAYADDNVFEAVQSADSQREQLICLYESGYLSKRNGKIQYLLPIEEAAIDRAMALKDRAKSSKPAGRVKAGLDSLKSRADAVKSRASALHKGGKEAVKFGGGKAMGKMHSASQYARDVASNMTGKEKSVAKGAGAAALSVGGLLAARSLYKRMKARKAAKANKTEAFNDDDIEFLVQEARFLGFDFDTLDALDEAITIGGEVDELLADNYELAETYSDEEIVTAYLEEDEEDLEEMSMADVRGHYEKGERRSLARSARSQAQKAIGSGPLARGAVERAASGDMGKLAHGKAKAAGAARAARAVGHAGAKSFKGLSTGKKAAVVGGAAGTALAGGLAARALYKRMKARKAAKKNESFTSDDLQDLVMDSQDLGFQFDTYDELVEAITVGELVDIGFDYYLGDANLTEDEIDEDVESEVMEALLYDLDEEDTARLTEMSKQFEAKKDKDPSHLAMAFDHRSLGRASKKKYRKHMAGTAAAAGLAGSVHGYKKLGGVKGAVVGGLSAAGGASLGTVAARKFGQYLNKQDKKSKNESLGYTGYRSSAQGGVYENHQGPVAFGTGNNLYNRIREDLL